MTNISNLNEEMRRIHKAFTKDVVVYNYTFDDSAGTNEYADGDWVETSKTVQGSIRLADKVEYEDDAAGNESDVDVYIWVSPEDATITVEGGDETRATEFYDAVTERQYRAIGFHDESSLYKVECREV